MDDVENSEKSEINNSDSRIYEVGFHIVPTASEEEVISITNTVKDTIESAKGAIFMEQNPLLVNLAYSMDHIVANKKSIHNSAYFGWAKFQIEPEDISIIKNVLEKNENIIRFLIIKTVREDTLTHKPIILKTNKKTGDAVSVDKIHKETKKAEISVEEVDKAIEELVVE